MALVDDLNDTKEDVEALYDLLDGLKTALESAHTIQEQIDNNEYTTSDARRDARDERNDEISSAVDKAGEIDEKMLAHIVDAIHKIAKAVRL